MEEGKTILVAFVGNGIEEFRYSVGETDLTLERTGRNFN